MPKKALGKGLGAIFGKEAIDTGRKVKKASAFPETSIVGKKVPENGASAADPNVSADAGAGTAENGGKETGRTTAVSMSGFAGETESCTANDGVYPAEHVSRETSGCGETASGASVSDAGGTGGAAAPLLVKTALIEPNRSQPRTKFDEESLKELAASIEKYGVLQPLLVKQNGMLYEIIAGERRWRAAKLAGLKDVPVIIKDFEPQERAEIAIIENIQREDLGPVEEARAYQALIDGYGLTQEEVAERVSKNRSTVTNSLRLLQLSEKVLGMLSDGALSAGHARCLIPLAAAEQEALAADIVQKKLSVRETEKLAKSLASGKKKKKQKDEAEQELSMYLIDLARKLTASLNTKVLIKQGSRGHGKIEIDYYSDDDLEKIISRLR